MRFALTYVFAVLAATALAADPLVVDTPTESVQCETTHITWSGGVPPFHLECTNKSLARVVPYAPQKRKFDGISEDASGLTEHKFDWITTNVPAGTVVTIEVDDATGAKAESASFTVQPSSKTFCL